MLEWLKEYVPVIQWVSSTALTLASLVLSIVAGFVGYRQSRGWGPTILVVGRHADAEDRKRYVAGIEFEVWNRRKYPINLSIIELTAKNKVQGDEMSPAGWAMFHGKLIYREDVLLEPNGHRRFATQALFEKRGDRMKSDTFRLTVYYFDPVKGRELRLFAKHRVSLVVEE